MVKYRLHVCLQSALCLSHSPTEFDLEYNPLLASSILELFTTRPCQKIFRSKYIVSQTPTWPFSSWKNSLGRSLDRLVTGLEILLSRKIFLWKQNI